MEEPKLTHKGDVVGKVKSLSFKVGNKTIWEQIYEDNTMKYRARESGSLLPTGTELEYDAEIEGIEYSAHLDKWFIGSEAIHWGREFEPVEQVQEGDYFKGNGRLYRVMGESEMYNCDWSCKQLISESSYTSMECPEFDLLENYYKLSTDEIEQVLNQERKRRGLVDGVKIKAPSTRHKPNEGKISGNGKHYEPSVDQLAVGGRTVYKKGEWAEKVDQAPHIEINGKTIDVEDGTVKISCGDTIEEEIFKNFYSVVNKYDLNVSRNGEQINEQLQQIWDELPNWHSGKTVEWTISVDNNW